MKKNTAALSIILILSVLFCLILQADDLEKNLNITANTEFYPDDTFYEKQWALSAINISSAWEAGLDGNGITIAVIDTGLSPNHPDIDYKFVLEGRNFSGKGDKNDVTDYVGHGTFITGVFAAQINNGFGIAGITDKVSVIPVKCMDSETGARESAIVRSISYAVEAGCDVIILSIGMTSYSSALEKAVDSARDAGVLLFSGVGNIGTSTLYYPAAYESVIGVGSIASDMKASSLSQRNESVFVVAPGEKVLGLWINAGKITYRDGPFDLYATRTGTSFAAPYVAAFGVMAKTIYPEITQERFKSLLIESSTDLGSKDYDTTYGYGLVNAKTFIDSLISRGITAEFHEK